MLCLLDSGMHVDAELDHFASLTYPNPNLKLA